MFKPNTKSAKFYAVHSQDDFTGLGFDYRGKILSKTVSPVIFSNKNNKFILGYADKMLDFLVDAVKQIRLQFLFSLNKNDRNLN